MSIRAYVPKNDRLHFLRLIGADTAPFEVNKFQVQKDGDKAENEETVAKEEDDANADGDVDADADADNGEDGSVGEDRAEVKEDVEITA